MVRNMQPQPGASFNQTHWMFDRCRLWVPCWEGAGLRGVDLIESRHGDFNGASPAWGYLSDGTAISLSGTTSLDCLDFGDILDQTGTVPFTVAAKGLISDASTFSQLLAKAFQTGNQSGMQILSFNDGVNPGGYLLGLLRQSAASRCIVQTTADILQSGVEHSIVFTWDGSQSASGWHIYVDGVDMPLTVNNDTLSGSASSIGATFQIGGVRDGDTSGSWLGEINDFRFYQREWSQAEVIEHHVNPWAPWDVRTHRTYGFVPAAGSAPTVVVLGVMSVEVTMLPLSIATGVTVALDTMAVEVSMLALTIQTGVAVSLDVMAVEITILPLTVTTATTVALDVMAVEVTMLPLSVATGVTIALDTMAVEITMLALTIAVTSDATVVSLGVMAVEIAMLPLSVSTGVTVALGVMSVEIEMHALTVFVPAGTTVELGTMLVQISIPEVFSIKVTDEDNGTDSVTVVLDVIPVHIYMQPLNKPFNRCGVLTFKADADEVVGYVADAGEVVGYTGDASETVTFVACGD